MDYAANHIKMGLIQERYSANSCPYKNPSIPIL
jgi:hypothetical protein